MKSALHAWAEQQPIAPHEKLALRAIIDFEPSSGATPPERHEFAAFVLRYRATLGWGTAFMHPSSWRASAEFLGLIRGAFGASMVPAGNLPRNVYEVQLPRGLLLQIEFDAASWESDAALALRRQAAEFVHAQAKAQT